MNRQRRGLGVGYLALVVSSAALVTPFIHWHRPVADVPAAPAAPVMNYCALKGPDQGPFPFFLPCDIDISRKWKI